MLVLPAALHLLRTRYTSARMAMRTLVGLAIFSVITFYVWRRLVHDTGLRGAWRLAATVAVLALVVPIQITVLRAGGGPPNVSGVLAWPAFVGWAIFLLLFAYLLIVDVVRAGVGLARKLARRSRAHDPARRQALARITGGAVSTFVVAKVGLGLATVQRGPRIVEEHFTLGRLPRALDGFTIVQLSDLHVGMTIDRAFIADVVARTNALGADAIVITGDVVDGTVADLAHDAAPLGDLRAPHGVYLVTGNHEYYAGVDPWCAYFTQLGIRVLRNERVAIGRAGATFDLAGIDDHNAKGAGHGPDLAKALAGRDRDRALVLLAHQPRQVHVAAKHDVDLQLSGHTHGGQVWPWHYLVAIQQGGLVAGRYQVGGVQLYVSRGTGHWGPPVRVLAPAEITKIVLRAPRTETVDEPVTSRP